MTPQQKRKLAHILWIGGATDSGKSAVAEILAGRYGCAVYHYDKADVEQTAKLAKILPEVYQFFSASLEERWIKPTPQKMFDYLLLVFPHRFKLVLNSLVRLPADKLMIVEGFGLLPELVQPVLTSRYQALWFVPTETFKWKSMQRRGKPSFAGQVSDPDKARMNLFQRDRMLAEYYRKQVSSFGYTLYEVDGSRSAEQMADLAAAHFSKYLSTLGK